MDYLTGFFKGLAMGVGAIAPGVSGGAIAVIFGLYDKITNFIAHLNINFKENLIYFIPVGIGGIVGVFGFSRIIEYLFKFYEVEVRYAFVGLMLGTLPSVVKQANKRGFKQKYLIPFFISLILTLVLTFMESNAVNVIKEVQTSPLYVVMYGVIIGFGTIIPGISASIILMYLGAYEVVIGAISNLQIMMIFFIGIGFVLSILLFAKLISAMFQKAYGLTYYTILGLVLGSIISIFPGFEFTFDYLLNCLILAGCCILSYSLSGYVGADI
ncbi:MAG: DUF368 domain-containing protein [Sedimentibacter sp.]